MSYQLYGAGINGEPVLLWAGLSAEALRRIYDLDVSEDISAKVKRDKYVAVQWGRRTLYVLDNKTDPDEAQKLLKKVFNNG